MIDNVGKSLEELGQKLQQLDTGLDKAFDLAMQSLQGSELEQFRLFQAKAKRLKNKALKGENIKQELEKLKDEHKNFK